MLFVGVVDLVFFLGSILVFLFPFMKQMRCTNVITYYYYTQIINEWRDKRWFKLKICVLNFLPIYSIISFKLNQYKVPLLVRFSMILKELLLLFLKNRTHLSFMGSSVMFAWLVLLTEFFLLKVFIKG